MNTKDSPETSLSDDKSDAVKPRGDFCDNKMCLDKKPSFSKTNS